ncbi:MAG TPA: VOC family protein [Flavobacteriales bacterium]|jgi:predicted 3-demethylubiquinone-9 3-methyltransferase (glyoxalase superfamily)|nr:VOC family protein [Flavobacteriales bacterium]
MGQIHPITPNLWFDTNAEEAVRFYVSVFPNSHVGAITHYTDEGFEVHGMRAGTVLTIEFELNGQPFLALNGGPAFTFNEAISFIINCGDQAEVDHYWNKLGAGGDPKAQQCGWVKDRFGLSWQVVPTALNEMLKHKDQGRRDRVMRAMLQMKKLDLAALQHAFEGR